MAIRVECECGRLLGVNVRSKGQAVQLAAKHVKTQCGLVTLKPLPINITITISTIETITINGTVKA